MKKATAICEVCGATFRYQPRRRQVKGVMPRRRCDDCRRQVKNALMKQKRQQRSVGNLKVGGKELACEVEKGVFRATWVEIAKRLNISRHAVEKIEKGALAKIRQHADLLEMWANFKADGFAMPPEPKLRPNTLDELLDYQTVLLDWWQSYAQLEQRVNESPGIRDELGEYLAEINKFHKYIGETLEKITGISVCQT